MDFIEVISRGNKVSKKAKKIILDRDTNFLIYNDTDFIITPVLTFEGIVDDNGEVHAIALIIRVTKE